MPCFLTRSIVNYGTARSRSLIKLRVCEGRWIKSANLVSYFQRLLLPIVALDRRLFEVLGLAEYFVLQIASLCWVCSFLDHSGF